MKKIRFFYECDFHCLMKTFRIMRITIFLLLASILQTFANDAYSQKTRLSLDFSKTRLVDVFDKIEEVSEFFFLYNEKLIDTDSDVTLSIENQKIDAILDKLFAGTDVEYTITDRKIILAPSFLSENEQAQNSISGKVTDKSGQPLPGLTVVVKGTTNGTVTNMDGNYSISNVPDDAVLIFSFVGMRSQEIEVAGKTTIDVTMEDDAIGIEEVVAIGYGTMKKSDLTGAVTRVNIENFKDQPNVSIVQSLHGAVAGFNVNQVDRAGEEPDISIRGRTSLSGAQNPLIVLDGVIFRGNLIDLNPADIESIDMLKDNSAAAVYGSQAANGVMLITTTKMSQKKTLRPTINYSAKYSFQTPGKELRPGNPEYFVEKISEHEWRESRTPESGYLEPNSNWSVLPLFKTNEQAENYLAGMNTNWYDLLTNDNMYVNNHNLSIANQSDYLNYFISIGYTDQQGHMINEGFERINARINVDSKIKDWLTVGIQAFTAVSDYSGIIPSTNDRYIIPFEPAYINGEINPMIQNQFVSPLAEADADNKNVRQNIFGNIYANIDIPFIKGLSYRINLANNYVTNRDYTFEPYELNFQGLGSKYYTNSNDLSLDNTLTFKRRFNNIHNLEITGVYGIEQRNSDYTRSTSSNFINNKLGYNKLQAGSSELQQAESGAWEEASLFSMARLFYSLKDKYLLTLTFRRDGFSGFSDQNKFGTFPSGAFGWVASEEPFFKNLSDVMNYLKLRVSYGSNGNRTVGRYQTLAKVDGGYSYVDRSGKSLYSQAVSSMASSELKWETTTGINLGGDFGFFNSRLNGSIEYYNNNTTDLLYIVDLPSIGRFNKFPDNLGRIHNHGIEVTLSSLNMKTSDFSWRTDFAFSRNRDELKELLGVDADGDGKEDDLISEGLFIGHSLNSIYDYEITGKMYQLGDDIPSGANVGTYIIVDQNQDEKIDPINDRTILGYEDPSYRFSIYNQLRYKNWSFDLFINSIQGGKDFYYQMNDVHDIGFEDSFTSTVPSGYDNYWLPENPDAKYQKRTRGQPSDLRASYYAQRNFVRLQNVSLSYVFNDDILKKIKVDNLRINLSGQNLLTLTKWEGWDPETGEGINRNGRPVLRSYTIGLNVEF